MTPGSEGHLRGIGMTSARTRARLVAKLKDMGICHPRVLDLIEHMPRHLFVDEAFASRAYENAALPIGFGQTISQPYTVARMTELAIVRGAPKNVLEIGTGCGYQTALLSEVAERVASIECVEPLFNKTRDRIRSMGFKNVTLKLGDGYQGWPSKAPFDVILAAAAPEEVPQALLDQLAEGGRLIMPVGRDGEQVLRVIDRTARGFNTEDIESVTFVPLVKAVQDAAETVGEEIMTLTKRPFSKYRATR